MKQKVPIQLYLQVAESSQINPNFYLSEPYLRLSGVECWEDEGYVWVTADEWDMFPCLPVSFPKIAKQTGNRIWSDFDRYSFIAQDYTWEFLDFEYIFNPNHFLTMIGGKWEVFRKNCRKWLKTNANASYKTDIPTSDKIEKLLLDWLLRKGETVQDAELIANYTLNKDYHINRKFLYNAWGDLVGINVWDENWKYLNYRFCIVRDEDYLDEYLRFLFYTDPEVLVSGKLVNDGGSLGNYGLERFKDKMNPVRKRKVYSWLKQTM